VDKFGRGERAGQLYDGTENGQRCGDNLVDGLRVFGKVFRF